MLDHAAIGELLPHGHPMLLVDRVVSLEPGVSAVGLKAITRSDPCYRHVAAGSAPEQYAYPASMMLESFGQTGAIVWLARDRASPGREDRVLLLVVARDCTIEGHAFPGDVLRHAARIDHVVGDNVFIEGEVLVGERRVASIGSMMAVLRPRADVLERTPQLEETDRL
jgi:3-hydroxyacyl-[acyl-carrier-protein] dehydratase